MYVLVIYNLMYSVDIYMFILFFIFLKQDSIWCFVVETRGEEKMKQKLGLSQGRFLCLSHLAGLLVNPYTCSGHRFQAPG